MIQYNLISITYDDDGKPITTGKTPCSKDDALCYMSSKAINSFDKAWLSGFKGTKIYKVPFSQNLAYQRVEIIFS